MKTSNIIYKLICSQVMSGKSNWADIWWQCRTVKHAHWMNQDTRWLSLCLIEWKGNCCRHVSSFHDEIFHHLLIQLPFSTNRDLTLGTDHNIFKSIQVFILKRSVAVFLSLIVWKWDPVYVWEFQQLSYITYSWTHQIDNTKVM